MGLKAMTHYHSPSGREALLASKLREKRANACTSGNRVHVSHVSGPVTGPCQHYLTSTTKCGEPVVPMTKYCPKHILEQQAPFKKSLKNLRCNSAPVLRQKWPLL